MYNYLTRFSSAQKARVFSGQELEHGLTNSSGTEFLVEIDHKTPNAEHVVQEALTLTKTFSRIQVLAGQKLICFADSQDNASDLASMIQQDCFQDPDCYNKLTLREWLEA